MNSNNNIFNRERINIILRINRILFPYLVSVTYMFLLLEVFKYEGFIHKYLHVDSNVFMGITIVSAIFLAFSKLNFQNKRIFHINNWLLPIFLTFYLVTQYLENVNYPNYIFSKIHIQPQNFLIIVILSFYLFMINLFIINKYLLKIVINIRIYIKQGRKKPVLALTQIILIITLFYFFWNSFSITINTTHASNLYIISNLGKSYNEKMQEKWGLLFRLISLIEENSDNNSSIILPPNNKPYSVEGKKEYYRYFLGKRELVNYDRNITLSEYNYIVVTKGYLHPIYDGEPVIDNIWPDFKVASSMFTYLYKDENNEFQTDVYYGEYNPRNFQDRRVWGLIEIQNNN